MNVTAAVSDRSRAKRPPRLIAYAYVQRRAGTGVTGVTRHYKPLRHVTFREYARTSAAEVQRSLAEMLTPWTMGHGRLSVGASLNRARLVVFPAFGSVQRRSREKNTRPPLPAFVIH